ncbi:MAG: hypothetical protein HY000_39430 [Planctomycetes bacterium]|nr:hypothetical protein [Planctomycetota bacterium]
MSHPDESGDEDMNVPLGGILRPDTKFYHEYDFGTTTELALRVMATREGKPPRQAITVLARNESPNIPCACGKRATQVCCCCAYEASGWVCDACASEHECGEEMLLPVVNSPRVGMCGYTGES